MSRPRLLPTIEGVEQHGAECLLKTTSTAETEKALRALFKQLRPPARAISHFPKPPQRREVCGFSIFYKGSLVREYFGKELLKEFEITAREKGLMCPARQNPRKTPKKEPYGGGRFSGR